MPHNEYNDANIRPHIAVNHDDMHTHGQALYFFDNNYISKKSIAELDRLPSFLLGGGGGGGIIWGF